MTIKFKNFNNEIFMRYVKDNIKVKPYHIESTCYYL